MLRERAGYAGFNFVAASIVHFGDGYVLADRCRSVLSRVFIIIGNVFVRIFSYFESDIVLYA